MACQQPCCFYWRLFAFCKDAPRSSCAFPRHEYLAQEDKLASTAISIVYYVCLQRVCTRRGGKKSSIPLHKFPFSKSTVPFNILCGKGKRKQKKRKEVWQQSRSLRQFPVSWLFLSVQEYGDVPSQNQCWNKLCTPCQDCLVCHHMFRVYECRNWITTSKVTEHKAPTELLWVSSCMLINKR